MRLRRLNLIRYGHFTDFTLDFGERPVNCSDFHVIFGDNEAGKSTAFNGYLDLLFGIDERTKYNFMHDYAALRISAVLEIENTTIELARIKRRSSNLLGSNDQPVDQEIITSALHGLSRDAYQAMFSLNDDTLERGGEEILASKGDFGRLLFAGTAGLADLSEELELLRERANKIYAERSRTYEIASLQQKLKQLKEERQSLDVQVGTYERLTETRQKAEKAYVSARSELDAIRNELLRLNVFKNAFAIRDELNMLENELAPVNHLPDVPEGWAQEVRNLQEKLAVAKGNRDDAQTDINNANKKLENLAADPMILKIQEELATVATLEVHNQTACEYLPKLHDELLQVDAELNEIRQRLCADKTTVLADLVISDDTIANLEELSQKEAQLLQRLDTAQLELADAKEALLQAQEEEKKAAPPDEKVTNLVDFFNRYTENDAQHLLDEAEKKLSQIGRKIERELKNLAPWTGNQDNISSQDFPTFGQANIWHKRADSLKTELANQVSEQIRIKKNRANHDSALKTLLIQVGSITDVCAANSRKARENAWATHRERFDDETADTFEKVLAHDDHIRDEQLAATDRLAQLRIAEIELAKTDGVLKIIAEEINRIESHLQALQDEMRPVFIKAGLPSDFQVENLTKWLERVQCVCDLIEERHECHAEWNQVKGNYDKQRLVLLEALTRISHRPLEILDLRELCAIAKRHLSDAIKNEERHILAKKAVSSAEEQIRRRAKTLNAIENGYQKWKENWEHALEGLWLERRNVFQIRALLAPLRKVTSQVREQKKLIETINAKETDCHKFREGVCKLLHSLGLEKRDDVDAQFILLKKRLEEAQNTKAIHDAATSSYEQAKERLEKAKNELSRIDNRVKEMAANFPSPEEIFSLDQLAHILDYAKQKRELVKSVSEKERHLLGHLGVTSRADAELKLETLTLQEIEARLANIDEDYKVADRELERRVEERRDAFRAIEAIGDDAGVVRLAGLY